MDYITYLNQVLEVINKINKNDELYARLKNAVRIYYLEVNLVFTTERFLKKMDFSNANLDSSEIKHIENAGWILDQKYLDDVYLPGIKTHFIFDIWYILKSFDKKNEYEELKNNFGILVDAMGNNFKLKNNFKLNGIEKNTGELVDFVTPDFILGIAKLFVK